MDVCMHVCIMCVQWHLKVPGQNVVEIDCMPHQRAAVINAKGTATNYCHILNTILNYYFTRDNKQYSLPNTLAVEHHLFLQDMCKE